MATPGTRLPQNLQLPDGIDPEIARQIFLLNSQWRQNITTPDTGMNRARENFEALGEGAFHSVKAWSGNKISEQNRPVAAVINLQLMIKKEWEHENLTDTETEAFRSVQESDNVAGMWKVLSDVFALPANAARSSVSNSEEPPKKKIKTEVDEQTPPKSSKGVSRFNIDKYNSDLQARDYEGNWESIDCSIRGCWGGDEAEQLSYGRWKQKTAADIVRLARVRLRSMRKE